MGVKRARSTGWRGRARMRMGCTHGSLLAAQGVHPRVAMELMGHSQLSVTMQVYTHVAPELAREAADQIDALLSGAN